MTSRSTAKIRLVKCPRCHQILPELSHVPVYQCGGCNAVLVVKNWRNGNSGSDTHEVDASVRNEVQCHPEDKETQEEALKQNLQMFKISGKGQKETKVSDEQESQDIKCFSSNRESLAEATAEAEADLDKYMSERVNEHGQAGKQSEDLYTSDDIDSPVEFKHHEREEENHLCLEQNDDHSSIELNCYQNEASSLVDEDRGGKRNCSENSSGKDRSESGDCDREDVGTSTEFDAEAISRYIFGNFKKDKLLAMEPKNPVITPERLTSESTHPENLPSPLVEQCQIREAIGFDPVSYDPNQSRDHKEYHVDHNSSNEASPSNELTCQGLEDSVVGRPTKLEEDSPSLFINRGLKENPLAASSGDFLGESNLKENLTSNPSEHLEQSRMREPNRFDRASSMEKLENIVVTNPNSMQRSDDAYDGSLSSYCETDYHDAGQYSRELKGKHKEAESSRIKALPRKSEMSKNYTNGYPDSISNEQKSYAIKGYHRHQDQFHGARGRDEHLSGVLFQSRVSTIGYGYTSPSNHMQNQFHCDTTANLHPMPEFPKEKNMELRKMVALQDQLNRSCMPKSYASGLNHSHPCYNAYSGMHMGHDLSHSGYPRRGYQRGILSNQGRFSRIPFSADCSSHVWHCSAPIPAHVHYTPSQYMLHKAQNHYDSYRPCSSSPRHNADSQFPLVSGDSMFTEHLGKQHEGKKYFRERNHTVKRHVLPAKGGAPFVVCYHCWELLQLPADFLLFRKRCHRLRCSSCSSILEFSLHNDNCLDRYMGNEADVLAPAPPPSEVDDHSEVNAGKKMVPVDPVCYSHDYGPPSVCRSWSTEGEPLSAVLPFGVHKGVSNGKNMSAADDSDHMKGRESRSVLRGSQSKYKDTIFKAKKPSREIEKTEHRDASPLHRLMGYNSARQVLDG